MKRLFSACLMLIVAVACGSKPVDANGDGIADGDPSTIGSVTQVAPSSPKGTVSGRVLSARGAPLPGVSVLLSGKEKTTATTDDTGGFLFEKITGGSAVGLNLSHKGYASAWAGGTVPGAAGNFPLNDGQIFVGPIQLIPNGGSLTFQVVGYDGAFIDKPIGVLDVSPRFINAAGSSPNGVSSITSEATGAAGLITFSEIPPLDEAARLEGLGYGVRYSIYILPVDRDGDGIPDYGGQTQSFSPAQLITQPSRIITLPSPATASGLAIIATNVSNLTSYPSNSRENLVPPSGPIFIGYNQRITKEAFTAELRNDDDDVKTSRVIPVDTEVSASGTVVRISPRGEQLTDGAKYNLNITATARDGNGTRFLKSSAPFFAGSASAPGGTGTIVVRYLDKNLSQSLEVGETLEVAFAKNVGRPDLDAGNLGAGFMVPIYVDYDLNGSGMPKDAPGEYGSGRPLCLRSVELISPTGRASGYARKATLVYGGPKPIPTNTNISVAMSEAYKCNTTLQSVYGEALTSDVELKLIDVKP